MTPLIDALKITGFKANIKTRLYSYVPEATHRKQQF